jgi:hypothetical protein
MNPSDFERRARELVNETVERGGPLWDHVHRTPSKSSSMPLQGTCRRDAERTDQPVHQEHDRLRDRTDELETGSRFVIA